MNALAKSVSIMVVILFLMPQSAREQDTLRAKELEATLTLVSTSLHEGEHFVVRVEIQNIGKHVVLVSRDLNLVSNMPYRVEIRLEDTTGHRFIPYGGAAVDFLELPDLQRENGLLKWRIPLYPATFIGSYFTLDLKDVPPGKYKLHGRYILGRPPHGETDLERALVTSGVSIFQGAVETNSIDVEVLPRAKD